MPRKFNWLGNPIVDNLVTVSWSASGLATLDDVKAKGGLFCGTTGGGPTTVFPRVINQLLGTQIKVVAGYRGPERGQHRHGARRGELHRRHDLVFRQSHDAADARCAQDQCAGAVGHLHGS